MHHIILDSETDFDGWRKAARALAQNGVKPADVIWSVRGAEPGLFAAEAPQALLEPQHGTFNVPAKLVELAQIAILHRNGERFALLYRLLRRLLGHHDLLDIATDPDVARVAGWSRPCAVTSTRCTPLSASARSAASAMRATSPGSSRSTTSSSSPRRSSRAALPTCRGRS